MTRRYDIKAGFVPFCLTLSILLFLGCGKGEPQPQKTEKAQRADSAPTTPKPPATPPRSGGDGLAAMKCADIIPRDFLTSKIGGVLSKYKEEVGSNYLQCSFTLNDDQKNMRAATIMVWAGESSYDASLKSVRRMFASELKETNHIGARSFEYVPSEMMRSPQLGFLSTNRRFSVHMTVMHMSGMERVPSMEFAVTAARKVDSGLSR